VRGVPYLCHTVRHKLYRCVSQNSGSLGRSRRFYRLSYRGMGLLIERVDVPITVPCKVHLPTLATLPSDEPLPSGLTVKQERDWMLSALYPGYRFAGGGKKSRPSRRRRRDPGECDGFVPWAKSGSSILPSGIIRLNFGRHRISCCQIIIS
jgi:hypothetical protein